MGDGALLQRAQRSGGSDGEHKISHVVALTDHVRDPGRSVLLAPVTVPPCQNPLVSPRYLGQGRRREREQEQLPLISEREIERRYRSGTDRGHRRRWHDIKGARRRKPDCVFSAAVQ